MREAAEPREGQAHLKRVVAEMGGKNCIIVDSDADLDEAVPAIVASAFSYAGQKCSACARVLAHEHVADVLLERLAGAVAVLQVGTPEDLATDVPPLIEREHRSASSATSKRARDGRIIARAECEPPQSGWYCSPTLAGDLPPETPVLCEEVFGPLLTVERVASVEAACELVDSLPFALTGGLFSRNPTSPSRSRAARRSATSTSTATSPARWSVANRSAARGSRGQARGPAVPTT